MSSFYVIKALNTFAYVYQRFETIPIQWSVEEGKFLHIPDHRKLITWNLHCFIAYVFGNGSSMFLLAREILSPTHSLPLFFALIQVAMVLFASLWMVVAITSVVMGDDYINCWNGSREFLVKLRNASNGYERPKYDIVGFVLFLMALTFNTFPILMTTTAIVLNMDPFCVLIIENNTIYNDPYLFTVATVIRIALCFICVVGGVRVIFLVIIIFITLNRTHYETLQIIDTKLRWGTIMHKISKYTEYQLYLKLMSMQDNISVVLMATGLFITVAGNFACVVYYNLLPFYLFLCIGSPVLVTYFAIHMMIPRVIIIHEISLVILHRLFLSCGKRKSLSCKKIRSLQSSHTWVSVGDFRLFYLKQSTRSTFYMTVFDMTIDLLMGIPHKSISSFSYGS